MELTKEMLQILISSLKDYDVTYESEVNEVAFAIAMKNLHQAYEDTATLLRLMNIDVDATIIDAMEAVIETLKA